jgi:hypothetical protein
MNSPNVGKTLWRRLVSLSPGCKEATRLHSAALDRRLTLFERIGLGCHVVLCKWCRHYGRQIKFLRAAARDQERDASTAPPPGLSLAARERIKRRLQSEQE